ncbi:hypothetical protein ABPG72_000061 [Tetrahymena utriculariae]
MFKLTKLSKLAFPILLAGTAAINQKRRTIYAFTFPSTPDLIRGEYENKIRQDSPPEKIFEVFATEKDDEGNIQMSHEDFFKSISPFQYSAKENQEEKEEEEDSNKNGGKKKSDDDDSKKEQKKIHSEALSQFADIDKDGKISIYEYYMVTAFLQIDQNEYLDYFKQKQKTDLNAQDMQELFSFIKQKAKVKLTMANLLDSRKFNVNKDTFQKHVDLCIKNLLGDSNSIPATRILKIKEDITKDVYKYLFDQFEANDEGKISGEDFAKSLISFMEHHRCKQYLKRLNNIEFKGYFSFEEFYTFSKFLTDNKERIEQTIKEKGYTNRKQFKKLMQEYQISQNVAINIEQVNILIKVLDANNNNRIEADEFKALILNRPAYGSGEDTTLKKPYEKLISQGKIWLNKAEKIWEIIIE